MLLHHSRPGPGAALFGTLLAANVYLAGLTAGVVLGLAAAGAARRARHFYGGPRPGECHHEHGHPGHDEDHRHPSGDA